MRQKRITVILLIINITVTAGIVVYLFAGTRQEPNLNGTLDFETVENAQYILYIGTNDKDTYEQIIPTDEAREIVNAICAKYVDGYTSDVCEGGWVDEKNILTEENTLVYTINGADETAIISIMDEVLTALNQNAVLAERRDVSSVFYRGKSGEK